MVMTEDMVSNRTSTPAGDRPTRPAGAPPGPRRREQRFGALLDSAASLFVEKGVAATSIDDIALRAGVAKGTFYHYFQDRAAMLGALRMRYCQHFAEKAKAAMDGCDRDDWQSRLELWVDTVVQGYVSTYALHDAIFHDPSVSHRCMMSEEPIVKQLAALLRDGERAGVWGVEDAVATAVCMFHSAHGLVDEAILGGSDPDAASAFLARMFRKMLRPD